MPRMAASAQFGGPGALSTLSRRLAQQLPPHIEHVIGDSDQADDVLHEGLTSAGPVEDHVYDSHLLSIAGLPD